MTKPEPTEVDENPYQPNDALVFFDNASHQYLMLGTFHSDGLWLFYKHPDGHWVSQRKARGQDIHRIIDSYVNPQVEPKL